MASRGRKGKGIAHAIGGHRTTVPQWLNRYPQHGLPGLTIQWAPGQAGRLPESFASTLPHWLKEGPQSCGLDRPNSTYEELAVHFYRTTGIEVKRTAMRVFCQRHQSRPYRPP
jgi:transposase